MKSKVLQRKMFRDPSQDENVGIMQGFMDDIEDLLEGMGEAESREPDADGGVSRAMERRPNSPEILMNNLRGDMRSVDARVEELADMVGYNAAASTPPEVLALLQPMLKQGIASLPTAPDQGLAMPPPGMPAAGMPPPGMPFPAAGMPTSSGEGGGIASLPQGEMPMDQGPRAMAKGGYVQRFQQGSGEEGVTPVDDTSSFFGENENPELIRLAQQWRNQKLMEAPASTPSMQEKMAEYVPIYQTLLGQDPSDSQAQMLFDISQRALNYAGNVNDRGEALRGSAASRLAGAFASLPAAIGARVNAMAKEKQALNMAALEAGQKDIDSIRATNSKLLTDQTRAWLDLAKTKPGEENPFGTSLGGRILNIFRGGAAAYGSGSTTPDQDRIFESAIAEYTKPTTVTYMDPTGRQVTEMRVAPLPEFVANALAARKALGLTVPDYRSPGLEMLTAAEGTPAAPTATGAAPAPTGGAPAPAVVSTTPSVPTPAPVSSAPMIPPDAMRSDFNPSLFNYNGRNTLPNIYNAAGGTGIMAALTSGAGRLPFVGDLLMPALDEKSAQNRAFIFTQANAITAALQNSPTYAQQERKQIEEFVDILPKLLDNKASFERRVVELDVALEQRMLAAQADRLRILSKPQNELTTADRELLNNAQGTLAILNNVRTILGAPTRVFDPEDPRLSSAPPGSQFMYNGELKVVPYPRPPYR